jgi:hypothetical protein
LATSGGIQGVERFADVAGGLLLVQGLADLARVSPSGWTLRAAWICSGSGSPVAPVSAQFADRET